DVHCGLARSHPLARAVRRLASPQGAQPVLDRSQGVLHSEEALDVFLRDEQRGHPIPAYPGTAYLMSLGPAHRAIMTGIRRSAGLSPFIHFAYGKNRAA